MATTETKTEMVVMAGVAAIFAYLWWSNRGQTAYAPGDDGLTITTGGNGGTTAPAAGDYNVSLPVVPQEGGPSFTFNTPGGAGSCGCPACSSANLLAFGSVGNLTDYLSQIGAAALGGSGLANWY